MRKLLILLFTGAAVITGISFMIFLIIRSGDTPPVWTMADVNYGQGRNSIVKYGCYACHVIQGVSEGAGRVGPKLEEIHEQIYIGGVLPNSPDNMINWIKDPQQYSAQTAMPDMGVTQEEARNITAYLFNIN